jgi:hypothetical protein
VQQKDYNWKEESSHGDGGLVVCASAATYVIVRRNFTDLVIA